MFVSTKLKKQKKIKHFFFSRKNGFSKGVYKSLNCGLGSKDSKLKIKRNLCFVSNKLQIKEKNLKLMYQTHSSKVSIITEANLKKKRFHSDAMITALKGIGIGVLTADCVPIILYEKKKRIVGCIHAGWKGALMGIIENTIKKISKINPNSKILACVGPCIGKKNYEVDIKFYNKFITKSKKNKIYFSQVKVNKKLFDLRKFVYDKLKKSKVEIDNLKYDTFQDKNNFFSYRRSKKLKELDFGRNISAIVLI